MGFLSLLGVGIGLLVLGGLVSSLLGTDRDGRKRQGWSGGSDGGADWSWWDWTAEAHSSHGCWGGNCGDGWDGGGSDCGGD